MNWNFGNEISMYSNIYGILYYYLTNELLERFGDEGEDCARTATTEYGHFRGRLLRKDHEKKGYEINLETFQAHYDLPTDERSLKSPKDHIRPGETRSKTYTCQFSDMWKYLAGQEMDACSLVGRIYCESFHPAMWEGYDSRLIVDLETFVAKGDDVCRFHTITAAEPRDIPVYMPARVDDYDWRFEDKMEVMSNICAFEYFFLAKEAISRFGDQGKEAIRVAVGKYGECRGKLLAQYHQESGKENTLENLFQFYDIEREGVRYQLKSNCVEVMDVPCRFCEICKILEDKPSDGGAEIAAIYCKEFYPGLIRGYNAALGNAVTEQAYGFGDANCRVEFR